MAVFRGAGRTLLLWALAALPACAAASPLESVGLYGHAAVYIDLGAPIERVGSQRKLWTVSDYKQRQTHENGQSYRSSRAWMAIDCQSRQARVLHLSFFEGPMQSGKAIEREGILHEWLPIPADSPIARIAYKVC